MKFLPARAKHGSTVGFTLLEIVVGVAVLGLGVGMAMEIFSGGLNNLRRVDLAHRAMHHAENVMNEILSDGSILQPTQLSGPLDNDFSYSAVVDYWQPPGQVLTLEMTPPPVEVLSVVVQVHFSNDPFGRTYRVMSLKTVPSDPTAVPTNPSDVIRQLFRSGQQ